MQEQGDDLQEQLRTSGMSLIVEHASAEAVAALRDAGVRSILLKGPLQQEWLRSAGPPRASIDVDVLVSQADLERAERALETFGRTRAVQLPTEQELEHASLWVAPGRVPVELHWSIVGADESLVWDVLAAETEPATIGGEVVEIPNETARCLIVGLHAAQHGRGDTEIFGDLERAVVVSDHEQWRRALELARAVGAETPFVAALSLTSKAGPLLEALGVKPLPLTDRQALSLITPAPAARGFYFLSSQGGLKAKVAFLAAKLVPGPTFMRLRYPLARRGPFGLALAYLYRPYWLVRWAVPGFRSWREAQRIARESRSEDR